MSKQRAQGTRYEGAVKGRLTDAGYAARRLPEGGSLDEGDVEADLHGIPVVIECKARQVLNVQETLAHTRRKAPGRLPIVAWKRLVRVPGKTRRQPVAGEPEVLVLAPADLLALLAGAREAGYQAGLQAGTSGPETCTITGAYTSPDV